MELERARRINLGRAPIKEGFRVIGFNGQRRSRTAIIELPDDWSVEIAIDPHENQNYTKTYCVMVAPDGKSLAIERWYLKPQRIFLNAEEIQEKLGADPREMNAVDIAKLLKDEFRGES